MPADEKTRPDPRRSIVSDVIVGDVRAPMIALMGAVALVLLIACANVANLLLLRGEARRREMAMRSALGAGRGAAAQQVLAEGLVLSVLAGSVGLAVAWASLRSLVTIIPDGLPRVDSIRVDPRRGPVRARGGVVAAVLASIAPALRAARQTSVVAAERYAGESPGGGATGGGHWWSRRWRWPSRCSPPRAC